MSERISDTNNGTANSEARTPRFNRSKTVQVIIGMVLMSGTGSGETTFDASIFDARHIKLAPAVCLFGYLFMIYAIVRKPRK